MKRLYYFSLLSLLIMTACGVENNLHSIPEVVEKIPNPETSESTVELDVLLVLDNSCSMMADWDYITYGLTQVPEELNDYGYSWRLGITSMDPLDGSFFEIEISDEPGWDMVGAIDEFRSMAGGRESGFDGALRAQYENPDFFRDDVISLIVFVSDEKEQSEMSVTDFNLAWGGPHAVAGITGPLEILAGESSCADEAPKYHEVSQVWIDICTKEPWSILGLIVE